MGKKQFSYGVYLLVLVLLCSLFIGCSNSEKPDFKMQIQENTIQNSQLKNDLSENSDEESYEMDKQLQEEVLKVKFEVRPGAYLLEILQDLVDLGWGESSMELLQMLEAKQQNMEKYELWSRIPNLEERAFAAEGYIAPGIYEWEETASIDEVLDILLISWDRFITEEMIHQAMLQGYTMDEVLIMASIVEWESSFDPYNIVKKEVAAVVRNRIESETPLQMDVTIFYLQEALEPYKDPQLYEEAYDTYIRSTLPAGPIGSPSLDSIVAVLMPADTQDLFFVYDEEGNYYFAEDYDQHLINCDLAGIY